MRTGSRCLRRVRDIPSGRRPTGAEAGRLLRFRVEAVIMHCASLQRPPPKVHLRNIAYSTTRPRNSGRVGSLLRRIGAIPGSWWTCGQGLRGSPSKIEKP